MSKVMRTHTGITEWNGDYWCDSCGKRVRGITTVNGMDFCAKCYQETFGETDKDRKIADLEAKLAESEHRNEQLIDALNGEVFINYKLPMENAQLKQQLAEKEKQIRTILKENEELVIKYNVYNYGDKIQQDKVYSITGEALDFLINNQDKISFALEQLEKVKNRIESKVESIYKRLDDLNIKIVCESTSSQLSTYEEIVKDIDNQIAELKKGVE